MKLLNDMDEKLKMIDAFNGQLKEFHGKVVEIEAWLPTGRARMDELLNPDNPTTAEDRVVQTMELQVRNHSQFYIQLVFKAPLFITLRISDQKNREW